MNKLSTKAIHAILAASICAWAPLTMGEIRIGDTPARQIAKDATLRGKYADGQCLPFARALHARLKAAGITSKVISFNYETLPTAHSVFGVNSACAPASQRGVVTGTHAVVAYNDQGRTYVMDNQSWQPKWIHNDSPVGMARQFSGMNTLVAKARVIDTFRPSESSKATYRTARLFRAHAPSLHQQVVAQSTASGLHPKFPIAGRRYGFVDPIRSLPLREALGI